jgi:hypothetical protein
MQCPDDKKKKNYIVCRNRHYIDGKYYPCNYHKGRGCMHPKRAKEEKK